jgi:hypothetical protein
LVPNFTFNYAVNLVHTTRQFKPATTLLIPIDLSRIFQFYGTWN